jgi:malonate-semialdehyde dehydrogenase (acetylating)/methylmalonate-semialdehyde dehydrogenase
MSEQAKKLKYCVNGEWLTSETKTYMNCYNPSTGEVIAQAPQCTAENVFRCCLNLKRYLKNTWMN